MSQRVITSQENLLTILRKFYVCQEPKPNKAKLWISKKSNFFVEIYSAEQKKLFPKVPWSFDKLYADSRLVRKIRSRQKQRENFLLVGERKEVRVKYVEKKLDFVRTQENDGLDRIRLEVEGRARDCFFNSHHRQKYSEKLSSLRKGEELSLVLLGGKNLVFVDRVIC